MICYVQLADLLPLEQPTTPDAKPRCPANRVLRQLNLGRNPIGREGAQMLATALKGDAEGPPLHAMQVARGNIAIPVLWFLYLMPFLFRVCVVSACTWEG